ncbi:DUF6345 domain-containing protein [Planosporangium sp. 12N6]|uniref:DUF6345 domain-containing protein n=1 Tax=Planosporangium spinosum TaxID=3402278 RepID=UPI003CF6A845
MAVGSSIVLGAALLVGGPAAAAAEDSAPVYTVTQEGLTADEGAALAKTFDIPNALQGNGAFSYVDSARFGQAPLVTTGKGRDESGRDTVSQALDYAALDRIKPVPDDEAVRRGSRLLELAGLSADLVATPTVSHTELTTSDNNDRVTGVRQLDTAVTYQLSLDGRPVRGQGAKLRVTFGPDGTVTQLSHSLRKVERAENAKIINPDEAAAACARLYPEGTRQLAPTLGYQFPPLAAQDAGGKGTVSTIFPQYTCNPVAETGALAHRLVPAVPEVAPGGKLGASRAGDRIKAEVSVSGGTAPYTYQWSSSTTTLPSDGRDGPSVAYTRSPRDAKAAGSETVTVEVTDANGLVATASIELSGDGTRTVETVPGGGGFGALAIGPVDVGIEQTVDEWQCAQDSAVGFKKVMASHGVGTAFDWRGANAWEWDFKDTSLGGGDSSYVDNVDAAWYTGHGWSGGFTFKSSVTDTQITPADARWGNGDLEWLQLESCQVLRDTNGKADYFGRWGPAFTGLHILNGFHTNAYCVSGGTGGTFAEYLFPKKFLWWELRPALRVQSAWASMALDREPSGVVYRSMGLIGPGGVTNIGDYFWGQGPVGPDISPSTAVGKWAISGTV